MKFLYYQAWLRDAMRHPWQTGLSILGIAVGVAVVIAVDIVNDSARSSFEQANSIIAGRATHRIVGGPQGVDENFYLKLRTEAGITQSAPVVDGFVQAGDPLKRYRLLGIDPFAEIAFRRYGETFSRGRWSRLLTQPATGFVTEETAQRLNAAAGETIEIVAAGRQIKFTLLGVWKGDDLVQEQALNNVILADIATAQEILGKLGRLSSIDLEIPPDSTQAGKLEKLESLLTPDLTLTTRDSRSHVQRQMTRAFGINLTALSLLALVIGLFLIYNTMSYSVLRRRSQIGTLRTIGVTRQQIFRVILLEALVIALIATSLGILFGITLSRFLMGLVTQTIGDLYFSATVSRIQMDGFTLSKGLLLGLGATIAAASFPAWEATRTRPRLAQARSLIETKVRRGMYLAGVIGVGFLLAGVLLFLLPGGDIVLGFSGLFCLIFGYALLTPLFITRLLHFRFLPKASGLLGKMAQRSIVNSLSRTGVAIAALSIAVSATVGVTVMINSFRSSVEHWLVNQLRADIYLSLPSQDGVGIETGLSNKLRGLPGVETLTLGRWVKLEEQGRLTEIFAVDATEKGFAGFDLIQGEQEQAWKGFSEKDEVIVTEPLAYRRSLNVGDKVSLRTALGLHGFTIAGIYRDYGSDQGIVTMSRDTYRRYWNDDVTTSAALYLQPDTNAQTVAERIEALPELPVGLRIRPVQALRQASLDVFDRTFTITSVLRMLAVIVAVIGILASMLCLQMERAKEYAVLRTLGLTPQQLRGLIHTETGIMGALAGVLSLPIGIALAWILIVIINKRSFGWSISFHLEPIVLLHAVILSIVTALVAGIYPAYRMGRASPALALREE